jgi:hypothetical protein
MAAALPVRARISSAERYPGNDLATLDVRISASAGVLIVARPEANA